MLPQELEQMSRVMEKAMSIPEGAPVELITTERRRVCGRLDSASEDSVRLRLEGDFESVWPFEEIRALRRLDKPRNGSFGAARRLFTMLLP